MSAVASSFFKHIIVYSGPGSYGDNIVKQIGMFDVLNEYRKKEGRPCWKVSSVGQQDLIPSLQASNPKETLLVIPAGQSSHLEADFSPEQTAYIQHQFLGLQGGRLYATCGASYMLSATREYNGLSVAHPDQRELCIKKSLFPLFEGTAKGPLCPYPGKQYKVGFYSDAVAVTNGKETCTIYLSGGGSFFLNESGQKVDVLVKYPKSELIRLGKSPEEWEKWSNAAILAKVGEGTILLSMFHPYYGSKDIDVETYEKAFPGCGTNWRAIKAQLSSLDDRMRFVLHSMLHPLEDS